MDELIISIFYDIDNFVAILRSRTALKGCHFVRNLFLIGNNNAQLWMTVGQIWNCQVLSP